MNLRPGSEVWLQFLPGELPAGMTVADSLGVLERLERLMRAAFAPRSAVDLLEALRRDLEMPQLEVVHALDRYAFFHTPASLLRQATATRHVLVMP